MKVTALIPDRLIKDIKVLSQGKNITEALIIALKEWASIKRIQALNKKISQTPLQFRQNFTAAKVRHLNRKK
jgi:hypothetical protein